MTAPAVLAGPFRNTEFCLTGPRVVALFSEYDAACELRFRVLLPLIGHNHAVDDAPRLMPANRALPCRSSFPCRALISHTSNIKAGVDISRLTKSSYRQAFFVTRSAFWAAVRSRTYSEAFRDLPPQGQVPVKLCGYVKVEYAAKCTGLPTLVSSG